MLDCFVITDHAGDAGLSHGTMARVRIHTDTDDEYVHLEVHPEDARPVISFVLTAEESRKIGRLLTAGSELAGMHES
mgnify:CR=1 FL=1